MHVLKIEGKNFMRLKTVDVTLDSGVVEITGKNRQGKSTLLKMIEGLGGKRSMPEEPLTRGQKKGEFKVYLGEDEPQFIAKWTFNDKGNSYLTLESSDDSCGSPAEVLKNLISAMIDPWTFFNLANGSSAERAKAIEMIRRLMECDFDAQAFVEEMGYDEVETVKTIVTTYSDNPLDFFKAFENTLTEARKAWNSAVKDLEGSIELLRKDVPMSMRDAKIVSVRELIAEKDKLNDVKAQHDRFNIGCNALEDEVNALKMRYEAKRDELEAKRQEAEKMPKIDNKRLEEITVELDNMEEKNEIARKAESLREAENKLENKRDKAQQYDDDITRLRETRLEVMDQANMPVDNMTIEDGKIMLNGIPFEQASSAEALGASIDVAVALKPKLKTLVCHNASLLDEESKDVLKAKAKEHDFQMLLEVVRDKAQPGLIFVEDGIAKNAEESE